MKRLSRAIWTIVSSPALPPLVLGFFLVVYIVIAFFSNETLTVLMAFTRKSFFLAAVLALLPLNSACRIVVEVSRYLNRRRVLSATAPVVQPALYDENVDLSTSSDFADLEGRLGAAGYRTRRGGNMFAAWRGVSLSAARIIYHAGMLCLFAGILVSLESRSVLRQTVIEGEPFPTPFGNDGMVKSIVFQKSPGPILANDLVMEVAKSEGGVARFGVYPPALFRGMFVYPRYLGIALLYRFSAPDLPGGHENLATLPLYPPGREASIAITGSPYRITLSMLKPDDGSDPYTTGRMDFRFKLMKDQEVLFMESVPSGGEFARGGFRLAFLHSQRMVITDFIRDYGVLLIWAAGILFVMAVSVWLPVRLFFPRREMLFRSDQETIRASSRAEGRARRHAGVFHEVLDFLEEKRSGSQPFAE